MVASADSVSGRGLGYNKPFNSILKTPNINALDVATSLCKASVSNVDYINSYTFTTYDLNKLDTFLVEFDNLFYNIYTDSLSDINTLSYMDKLIKGTYQYTAKDHLDVGHYLSNVSNRYDTSACTNSLNELIPYSTRGRDLEYYGARGLSFYHPSGKYNIGTMNFFRNMITSPNYMKYLELTYLYRTEGDTSNFKDYSWANSPCFYESTFNFLNYFDYSSRRDTPRQMYHYLIQNEMYKNDGFLLRWCENMYNETP